MRPWDQQAEESTTAYRAARLYFEAGPGRSLAAVEEALRPPTGIGSGSNRDRPGIKKPSGTLRSWCAKHRWVERAEAFDRHFDRIFEQARAKEAVNQATLLEQKRLKIAEAEWAMSQALLQRVAEMLRFPISTARTESTTSPDGRVTTTTTISPANWRLRDIVAMTRIGIDLQRMSVGLPTRMASQPFLAPNDGASPPVDQNQADADNGRIPAELAEDFREKAARLALEEAGLYDVQPDQGSD